MLIAVQCCTYSRALQFCLAHPKRKMKTFLHTMKKCLIVAFITRSNVWPLLGFCDTSCLHLQRVFLNFATVYSELCPVFKPCLSVSSARDSEHNIHSVIYRWNPRTEVVPQEVLLSTLFRPLWHNTFLVQSLCFRCPLCLGHICLALRGESDSVHVRSLWLGILLRWTVPLPGGCQHLRRSDHHDQLRHLHLVGRQLPTLPEHSGQFAL